MKRVLVVGGGIAGATAAIALGAGRRAAPPEGPELTAAAFAKLAEPI